MQSGLPTFSVVAIVQETTDILELFVEHYRILRAEKIQLYFEKARPANFIPNRKFVEITELNSEFWEKLGRAPPSEIREIQKLIYPIARKCAESDWVLFLDADELLTADRPVQEILDQVPQEVKSLRIPNFEAAWGPREASDLPFKSTYFRKPARAGRFGRACEWLVHGRYRLMLRNGVWGHSQGKHFLRRSARVDEIHPHFSTRNSKPIGRWSHRLLNDAGEMFVAHFDALTYARWHEKWNGRAQRGFVAASPSRQIQNKFIARTISQGPLESRRLFKRLYHMGRAEYVLLRLRKRVIRRDIHCRALAVNGSGVNCPNRVLHVDC